MLKKSLVASVGSKAHGYNIFVAGNVRFTLLTSRLLRTEYSPDGIFEDNATQTVWFRDLPKVDFSVKKTGYGFSVHTADAVFHYNRKSHKVENITLKYSGKTVKCDNGGNLGGTARTLDMNAGVIKLDKGLVSKSGVSFFDDSKSFLLCENGEIKKREHKEKDIYIFAYGNDYRQCIRDFYKISGKVPLIPRYALGNWWSRYHAYTDDEYISLMRKFKDEDLPFTVAVIDMDWHWVDLKSKFPEIKNERKSLQTAFLASGWTGYSWNTDLFPDYRAFLKKLKSEGLHITLNLHPADGIRSFETMYEKTAAAMNIDPATGEPVRFDIGNTDFWNSYFDTVHKPYEKDGVDFWWIDWQQGTETDVKGLDPLWMLNHYHFLDNAESGQLPMILSRYAGLGSHRYPLGFSGDTVICYKSLKLQPYFTSTAANAGYTWWSHDIGGHTLGYKDDELYTRWVQLGVFSPIMRLHSSNNDLLGKEPWRYGYAADSVARRFLKLRHSLIPYIYTMDYRTHKDGIALCEPMYYSYPDEENAYKVNNEYFFGSELIACPITSKSDGFINTASVKVWLPDGRWTDFFTGRIYHGGKFVIMHRDINSFPLLAKEGAIIPLGADKGNSVANPVNTEIRIYRGNGRFSLYEDNGKTDFEKHHCITDFKIRSDSANIVFEIEKCAGDISVVPENRNYTLKFCDIKKVREYRISINGETAELFKTDTVQSDNSFEIRLENIKPTDKVEILITKYTPCVNDDVKTQIINVFSRMQCSHLKKDILYKALKNAETQSEAKKIIGKLPVSYHTKTALYECFEA